LVRGWIISYLGAFGIGGLLLGVVVEAMGIPFFPGGIMVILTGFLINQGKLNFYPALIAATVGFNLGAILAYLIGRHIGEPFFYRYGKYLYLTPQKFNRAQAWFEHSAPVFIIFGRFVPMVSNLTPYIAGLSKLNILKFLFYNTIFAVAWSAFNLSVGMLFGYKWETISRLINSRLVLIGGALLLFYLIYHYICYLRHLRHPTRKI